MLDNTVPNNNFGPYNNPANFTNGSVVPLLNPEQVQKVKSYAFWIKLIAILTFIALVPTLNRWNYPNYIYYRSANFGRGRFLSLFKPKIMESIPVFRSDCE